MVLIHGLGSERGVWAPVVPELAERFDVIAIDLPGFGQSPMPPGGEADLEAQAAAVSSLLDELGIAEAHFVGNSMGGRLALELARIGRAIDVVAISPHGAFTPSEGKRERAMIRAQRVLSRLVAPLGTLPFRTRLGRRMFLSGAFGHPESVSPEAAARLVEFFGGSEGFETALESINSRNLEGLEQIECPVLVLWGDRDRLLSPKQGPRISARIEGARLQYLPGLGHVPMWDDPPVISSAILGFCAPR